MSNEERKKEIIARLEQTFVEGLRFKRIIERHCCSDDWQIVGTDLLLKKDNGWYITNRYGYVLAYSDKSLREYWKEVDLKALTEKADKLP